MRACLSAYAQRIDERQCARPCLFYVVAQFQKGIATMPDFHSRNLIDAILMAEALERDFAEQEAEARKRWRKNWSRFMLALWSALMLSIGFALGYAFVLSGCFR